MGRWVMTVAIVALLGAAPGIVAQGPSPEIRARISAFVAGVMARPSLRGHGAGQLHAGGAGAPQPGRRRQLFERLHADFGTIQVDRVLREDDTFNLNVKGSTGLEATINLELEPDPPNRIAGLGVEVGGDDRPRMPAIPLTSSMSAAEVSKALDDYITPLVAADTFSGAVLVAKDGTPLFERAYGLADRAQQRGRTRWPRASTSGRSTRCSRRPPSAQLVAAGQAGADRHDRGSTARLSEHAGASPRRSSQLLDHRAGIADFFGARVRRRAQGSVPLQRRLLSRSWRRAAAHVRARDATGQYCNGCYIVLGAIIERVSGMPYEDYIARARLHARRHEDGRLPPRPTTSSRDIAIGYTHRFGPADGPLRSERASCTASPAARPAAARRRPPTCWRSTSALRGGRLLDAKMTAWLLRSDGGPAPGARRRRARSASPAARPASTPTSSPTARGRSSCSPTSIRPPPSSVGPADPAGAAPAGRGASDDDARRHACLVVEDDHVVVARR